ncbi:unnamed protein product [Sphagnum tenellum]
MKACLTETVRLRYLLLAYCLFYSVSVSECGTCPAGWQEGYNENVCLSLMTSTNDWNDSESTCVAKGGHLASLDTREEYQYLQSICTSGTTDGCWVGGHEATNSVDQWQWSNCPSTHTTDLPWVPSPPVMNCSNVTSCLNGEASLMCTVLTSSTVMWEYCNSKHAFICSLGQDCNQKAPDKEYIIILAVVSSLIFITTMGVMCFLLAYRRSKRRRRSRLQKLASLSNASGLIVPAFRLYTVNELESATQHFSEANLLGEARAGGRVYKGILPNGTLVAVKSLQQTDFQSQKEFVHDLARTARLRHPNLVGVKGCAYHGGTGFVVYDFIPNGSLEKWLHDLPVGARSLTWGERIRIATTVAQGISFLHDTLKPHVVHGDIRASNVLLDEQFDAHILGVGGRKVALRESTSGHTIAGGTCGYLAPEFVYEVTIKSDVYSFGVLLLELITGRKPIVEVDTPDWQRLLEWATPLVQSQHFIELLDPLIVTIPDTSQVQAVVDLVYSCTQHVPGMRPRMSHVVHQLQQLQQGLVPPPQDMNKVISGHNISSLELEIAEVPL